MDATTKRRPLASLESAAAMWEVARATFGLAGNPARFHLVLSNR